MGGVGFDYGKISRITSIDKLRPSLITQKCQSFRDNLKKKYNDTHGETKVLEKLKHPYKKSLYFASTFSEELTLLQNELQTNVEVDWASLEKAGYKNDFYVDYQFAASHYFKMNQIKVNLFDMLDLVLNDFGAGKAKLDYVIEGDTIFVSTEEEINRRIGFDPRAELKKLKEGKDENTQSIPATQKQ